MNTNTDFEQRLAESIKRVAQKRKQLSQPKLTLSQHQAIDATVSGGANRLIRTLFKRQGMRSDDLCIELEIRNISQVVASTKAAMAEIGLAIHCTKEPTRKRLGRTATIGMWFIRVVTPELWQEASYKAVAKAADKRLAA